MISLYESRYYQWSIGDPAMAPLTGLIILGEEDFSIPTKSNRFQIRAVQRKSVRAIGALQLLSIVPAIC